MYFGHIHDKILHNVHGCVCTVGYGLTVCVFVCFVWSIYPLDKSLPSYHWGGGGGGMIGMIFQPLNFTIEHTFKALYRDMWVHNNTTSYFIHSECYM